MTWLRAILTAMRFRRRRRPEIRVLRDDVLPGVDVLRTCAWASPWGMRYLTVARVPLGESTVLISESLTEAMGRHDALRRELAA